jgi:hypothetical protein
MVKFIKNYVLPSYATKKKKKKPHGLSPRANYTDRVTAACRRSDYHLTPQLYKKHTKSINTSVDITEIPPGIRMCGNPDYITFSTNTQMKLSNHRNFIITLHIQIDLYYKDMEKCLLHN